MRQIYYFDTSAINELHDDPERGALVQGFLATNQVHITALNVGEILKTPNPVRRVDLLRLLKTLGKNLRPLSEPSDYLARIARAFSKSETDLDLSVESDNPLWRVLHQPESFPESDVAEVVRWARENEDTLRSANAEVRELLQGMYAKPENIRPTSSSQWMREFNTKPETIAPMISPVYELMTSTRLSEKEIGEFLKWSPEWLLFVVSWLHSLYRQAIQTKNFSPRKNAGMMDLLCSVYLPRCDVFLTHDVQQRRSLRVIARLSPNRPRVQSYNDFRRRLLVL